MAFTVYLADSTDVTYEQGYSYELLPSGVLQIRGEGRLRHYAPGYWTEFEEHLDDASPGVRHATAPIRKPLP